jgi:ferredoxin
MIDIHTQFHSIVQIILLCASMVTIGHVAFHTDKLVPISRFHYFIHWLYGKYEPQILRICDWIMSRKAIYGNPVGRTLLKLVAMASHYFPHGIIVTTRSATNLLQCIEGFQSSEDGPRIAVGPCVCQMSLNRWKGPSCKDIVVLYGADIYLHLKRGYRIINAAEATQILESCGDAGLVHSLDFCMQSGKWHFVICNCDRDICVITRAFFLTGKMLYPGPQIVKQDKSLCLGADACGKCVAACLFGANNVKDGKGSVDGRKCMGCGRCVTQCLGNAREMIIRRNYKHDKIIPSEILLR